MGQLLRKQIGKVTVTVQTEPDYDPDLSWIGEYSPYREPVKAYQKLVHRRTKRVLDHHGIWRDAYGRIEAAPESNPYAREYEYIWCDNGHERIIDALRDAKLLEDINNGYTPVFGVVAEVCFAGKEIGYDSCWGYIGYSDSDDGLTDLAREHARHALHEAKKWLREVCGTHKTASEV